MTATVTETDETLLPYEWPGSYFIGEEEIEAVTKVLLARSPYRFYGHDLQRYADKVEDFYRKRLGRKHAVLVNSGTGALSTAMMSADVGPGDEVLVPGYMWVACVSSVVRCGALTKRTTVSWMVASAILLSRIPARPSCWARGERSGSSTRVRCPYPPRWKAVSTELKWERGTMASSVSGTSGILGASVTKSQTARAGYRTCTDGSRC